MGLPSFGGYKMWDVSLDFSAEKGGRCEGDALPFGNKESKLWECNWISVISTGYTWRSSVI